MGISHVNDDDAKSAFGIPSPNGMGGAIGGFQQSNPAAFNAKVNGTDQVPPELTDYNDEFKNADPIMFRERIISDIYAILLAKQKPNVLLVGPAGSGKTALAQEVARQISKKDPMVPETLRKMTVYELPLSNLVAGSSLVGQLENKIQSIVSFAENNNVILFIDEIHMLIGANGHNDQSYNEIAQILKPALARGKMHVIGATTTQEARDLMTDPAFNRRFSKVNVNEISQEQEQVLLEKALPTLLNHYRNKVNMPVSLLPNVAAISDDVLRPHTHRPDSGLTLLDRVMGEAIADRNYQIASLSKSDDPNAQKFAKTLQSQPQAQVNLAMLEQTAAKIASGMQSKPILTKDGLAKALEPVKYQDEAKDEISKLLLTNQLGVFNPNQPLSMLLVGSSGVGKTMLSTLVAKYVTKTEPIVLNMAEYNSGMAITRILGSSAGYVGSDSHAELPFDILDSNPYQVILLDEFDQADLSVQRLFMRVLDEGKLQLANNHLIDFSKAIMFITTNGNDSNFGEHQVGFQTDNQNTVNSVLKSVFEDKVLNRFSAIIKFNSITRDEFIGIMKDNYASLVGKLQRKINHLPSNLPDDVLNDLADKYYLPQFGARPAKKALEHYVQDQL